MRVVRSFRRLSAAERRHLCSPARERGVFDRSRRVKPRSGDISNCRMSLLRSSIPGDAVEPVDQWISRSVDQWISTSVDKSTSRSGRSDSIDLTSAAGALASRRLARRRPRRRMRGSRRPRFAAHFEGLPVRRRGRAPGQPARTPALRRSPTDLLITNLLIHWKGGRP
jgi:hypothetical protein